MRWIQNSLILLILIWVSFLIFYFSYLFRVLFLVFMIIVVILVYISGFIYIKYLVVLVYISGVVVFILYISCMCWFIRDKFSATFLFLGIFLVFMFDSGMYSNFSSVGEFMWIYLFFRFLFNVLVIGYSLNLFKVSGSLRF